MLERAEPILKLVCAGLVALLLVQAAGAARRSNPLKRTSVPVPPTWSPPTNAAPATGGSSGPGMPPGMPPGMAMSMPPGMPMGMPPGGRHGRGGPGGPGGAALSPEAEARLDKIIQSELLGPVMRPPPMALIGIAGKDVLLRGPNGQAGLVREGGEMGGAKLIRIGTNRVLVQEGTELKELMIFEGIGGESLMPKGKEGTP